jgi:gluconokinase
MTRDVIIVMGVAGSGKSTYAAALATRLRARFIEGDDLHSEAARAAMAAEVALTDEDRWPWLARIAAAVEEARLAAPVVATCSALKRSYRDALRSAIAPPLRFVFLDVPEAELSRRLKARAGHYMGPEMLAGQLEALERPEGEADVEWVAG